MAVESSKNDKREVVFEAAARLFMANGYMSTTMDDVAAAVSLNKGTLYYYYQGKSSILFDIMYRLEEGRLAVARAKPFDANGGHIAASLRVFIEDTANYILDNPISSRIMMQESPFLDMWLNEEQLTKLRARHDEYHSFLVEMIQAGMVSGELAPGNPSVAAQGVTGTLSWIPRWFRSKGPLSKGEVAAQLTEMLVCGLIGQAKAGASTPARTRLIVERAATEPGDAGVKPKKRPPLRRRGRASTRRARAAEINRDLS